MDYADLISRMQVLPEDKQAEQKPAPTIAQTPLAHWINNSVVVPDFKPFTRDEANER